jgi:TP901 family phage tail tape measure protein
MKPIVLPITYKSDPKGLRKAQDQLKGFAKGIGRTVVGATAAVAGIGAASIKAFADFDGAMTQSLAIMGDVSDKMKGEMSDAAREVAKQTTFSAEQAAESYFFLASAGLDAAQSIEAMPKVAAFAQAGMFDMALATDLLTDAQSALGLSSDDAAENTANMSRVSDTLVKANTLANASVQQFSEALTNKAGPAMKTVGMDIEEGVAVLAAFADQGIKGQEAGTQFSIVMRELQRRALENSAAFEQAGISVFDAQGEFRNFGDIMGDVEGRLDGMSDAQKKAELAQLGFADKSVQSLLALLGTSDAIKQYESDLRNAAGTTQDVADNQLDTISAQFDLLKSAVVDVGIVVGQALEPAFKDLITELKPVVAQVGGSLIPAFKGVMVFVSEVAGMLPSLIQAFIPLIPIITQIASLVFGVVAQLLPTFVAVLSVLLPIIESFTAFLANNVEVVTAVVIAFASFVAVIKTYNAVINLAKLGMAAFNAVMLMNPLGLILAAVVALTAALVWFFTQTEVGQQAWAAFTEFLTVATTAVGEWFAYVFGEWFPGLWQSMVDFFTGGWETFKEYFFTAIEAIGDFFKGIINGWITMFEGFINFVIGGVNKLINALNKISVDVPAGPFNDAYTLGINIPNVPEVSLPRLAKGGIVKSQPGGILANIGEGRYDEAVVPLKPGMGLGNTYNITVNAGMGTNGARVGEEIVRAIKQYERNSGPVFASA